MRWGLAIGYVVPLAIAAVLLWCGRYFLWMNASELSHRVGGAPGWWACLLGAAVLLAAFGTALIIEEHGRNRRD